MQTVELRQIKLHEIKHSDANKAIIDTPLEKPSKVAQDTRQTAKINIARIANAVTITLYSRVTM